VDLNLNKIHLNLSKQNINGTEEPFKREADVWWVNIDVSCYSDSRL